MIFVLNFGEIRCRISSKTYIFRMWIYAMHDSWQLLTLNFRRHITIPILVYPITVSKSDYVTDTSSCEQAWITILQYIRYKSPIWYISSFSFSNISIEHKYRAIAVGSSFLVNICMRHLIISGIILWWFQSQRLDVKMIISLWSWTGISAALLPRCPSNVRAIGKV